VRDGKLVVMGRIIKIALSGLVWTSDTLRAFGLSLLGRPRPARSVVLYYHAVNADERARFAVQMDMLKRCAMPVCANGKEVQKAGQRYVAVTFDDGFVSVMDHALPELESRDIPWTFFVPTGSWGQRPRWVHDRAARSYAQTVVTTDQLQRLGDMPSVTVGAHSITHPDFLTLDDGQACRELEQSKIELEQLLGRDITLFSFPYGRCEARLVEKARAAGYQRMFTITPSWAFETVDEFVTGRVAVEPSDWRIEFWLKVRGAYRWQEAVTGWTRQSHRAGKATNKRLFHGAGGSR
jgi:peptidoglycan/xylan/chitin deacetylase (PgdA/CDA1 family)